jgi:succinate dehydrogenase / fumarate reductase cytochrome b subunit
MANTTAKLSTLFNSSIGKKVIMSLTGLFLCSFLLIHLIGNLQLLKDDQGLAFNKYAVFMTTNPLIKTVSYLLYFSILFHAFKGLALAIQNRKARPVKYAVSGGTANSTWFSRNMALLGTVILVFIVLHMTDFWYKYKFGHIPYTQYTENILNGDLQIRDMPADYKQNHKLEEYMVGETTKVTIVKDLYKEVSEEFKELSHLIIYVLAMFAISFHLIHGFKSAFQTLGLNHRKYNGIIEIIGVWGFGILIPLGFAAMPVYFYFIK